MKNPVFSTAREFVEFGPGLTGIRGERTIGFFKMQIGALNITRQKYFRDGNQSDQGSFVNQNTFVWPEFSAKGTHDCSSNNLASHFAMDSNNFSVRNKLCLLTYTHVRKFDLIK